jgi:hypothetical protein
MGDRRVRSVTQRPNALLIAVDPFSPTVQGGSFPEGNVNVIELARRNCASKIGIEVRSRVHSTI